MTLRQRLVLTMTFLVVLLALPGGTGIALLYRVSNQIDLILRENYESVKFMVKLNEALERIDSAFNLALLGKEEAARDAYRDKWEDYQTNLKGEQNNITLPGERELVEDLTRLTNLYRSQGDAFFQAPADARPALYLGAAK